MSKVSIKIKPPSFSKNETKRRGLSDLRKELAKRLSTDMKQFNAYKQKQIDQNSEVYCYYNERTQLLRQFISEIEEKMNQYPSFDV